MKTDLKKYEPPTNANNMLVVESFIEWKNNIYKEMRGGKLMFDVPKYYKWLDESELLIYYMTVGRYCH